MMHLHYQKNVIITCVLATMFIHGFEAPTWRVALSQLKSVNICRRKSLNTLRGFHLNSHFSKESVWDAGQVILPQSINISFTSTSTSDTPLLIMAFPEILEP